ncbi:hypothetical protein AXG93_2818s1160 [Marchantia polymorpha subsp. ruderalis]|uniref:Uncharacterized protein n=1 Tax=Marchantia polymorpha subsp. ruderalis TaxID=1480154 RepID=A0A176VX95_MARPO|nr:hypothetical protein AXG93_2818s1160 [Marchantia polymorpha subsp. ruderalis]
MDGMTNLRGRIPSVLLAALVLVLSRLQSTGAVDCLFYTLANCQGTAVGCFGLAEGGCCGFPASQWKLSLLADVSDDEQQACTDGSSGCKNVMDPNAIVYNSGEGNWMLIKDNAMGLYEQLTNVPDSEKVAWLTAQGATYTSKTEEKMINAAN